jgi:hypothetical protein
VKNSAWFAELDEGRSTMAIFRSLILLLALFLLTSLLCWLLTIMLLVNPLCAIGLFAIGIFGIIVVIDLLAEYLFS